MIQLSAPLDSEDLFWCDLSEADYGGYAQDRRGLLDGRLQEQRQVEIHTA